MLYFDEQVSHHLIDPIVARGIDVTTVNRLRHKGLSDPVQLLRATELGRVVVTHNVADFILLHEAWLAWSDGIISEIRGGGWAEVGVRRAGILGPVVAAR